MNWAKGFIVATTMFGGAGAYALFLIWCILALGPWGIALAVAPIFALIVCIEASR